MLSVRVLTSPWLIALLVMILARTAGAACPDVDLGSAFPVTVTGSTAGAPLGFISSGCGGGGPDRTYRYTAPFTGTYVIDTVGSSFDTVLYVRAGNCNGGQLACNDDDPVDAPQSRVTVTRSAGQVIIIVVDGFSQADFGNYTLHIGALPTPTTTITSSPTRTATRTATSAATDTPSPTVAPSDTPTATSTATTEPVLTDTATPVPTDTAAPTHTHSAAPTDTPTPTPIETATPAPTDTATPADPATATTTASATATATETATPAHTDTATAMPSSTTTPAETLTPAATDTAAPTQTDTATPVATETATATPVATDTPVATATSAPTLCPPTPITVCKAPVRAPKGVLKIKDLINDRKDRLVWTWTKGAATDAIEFGEPRQTTGYTVCIYDHVAGTPSLLLGAAIPAGMQCGTKPCWKQTATGFRYKDPARAQAGIDLLRLKAGVSGKARLVLRGVGPTLDFAGHPQPFLPLAQDPQVSVQVFNSLGGCWGSDFPAPAPKNTGDLFRDTAE
jgi:hypothetical protein